MIRVKAPAKVNLFLEITGRRRDGYHTLSTLFQTISLADELTFSTANELSLRCSDASLPTDERNLVMRAAVRLRDYLGERRGALMNLRKEVPVGAGLGGGSSDAAAALLGLLRLWRLRLSSARLRGLATQLGADVPFFLRGGTCAAGGIGEKLRPHSALARTWLVLVFPGFGVATKDAYSRVRLPIGLRRSIQPMIRLLNRPNRAWKKQLFNRFEEFVFPDYPALERLKNELMESGAEAALMSGSGSSVFGVVPSAATGRQILAKLKSNYPRSWLVHTIGR